MVSSSEINIKFCDLKVIFSDAPSPLTTITADMKKSSRIGKIAKIHIRRPRNQFIIYRQWMSARMHAKHPDMTASAICKFPD
jgi:HMG (high mobility group) box.